MRPIRLLLTLLTSLVLITLLLCIIPSLSNTAPPPLTSTKKAKLRSLFSFHTPLFPPSAIISLTDDNSTFFLARPAAFGPKLPSNGLSGQLWIGSGFGEDNLGSGGRAEGELGCSDVPGWDESMGKPGRAVNGGKSMKYAVHDGKGSKKNKKNSRRADKDDVDEVDDTEIVVAKLVEDDGTDDHLYHPASELDTAKDAASKGSTKEHADIQSLQESAEIAGKVVLLSRGGCGFLEKVKWVQRRGGTALIVGDDIRGGPLVTMYARGDTSNVTIPALFTSYTTAHLLSSLIPSGGVFGTSPVDGNKAGLGKASAKFNGKENKQGSDDQPIFTTTTDASKPTAKPQAVEQGADTDRQDELKPRHGWLRRFVHWLVGRSDDSDVSRRPPGSGSLDWVMVQDFEDDRPKKSSKNAGDQKKVAGNEGADNFVIGVHDWRDPDMVPAQQDQNSNVELHKIGGSKESASDDLKLKGGIITPGSGEYERPNSVNHAASEEHTDDPNEEQANEDADGWLSHLSWNHDDEHGTAAGPETKQCAGNKCNPESESKMETKAKEVHNAPPNHEGLWVTLTPTNMSSSPFFDTLLVLVVSPLVTLTVVYALLLLRSRIRRRRWRAPKSVVERLPVRTYHTIASEASTTSLATPNASSPTTPLLQPATRRISSRSSSRTRPRSRTTSEVPAQGASSSLLVEHQESPSTAEKRETALAEWRRKYGGRQRECVVCLEEYVDGVSRVMSLPCGHEFHAECM
jgi:hypothetical protein